MTHLVAIGTTFEAANWFDPSAPGDRAAAEHACRNAMQGYAMHSRVVFGPLTWSEKKFGDERVPPPPVDAPPGVRLLYCEADVVAFQPAAIERSFAEDLDAVDRARLREITRRQFKAKFPHFRRITDAECDNIINEVGPDAAVRALKSTVESGALN